MPRSYVEAMVTVAYKQLRSLGSWISAYLVLINLMFCSLIGSQPQKYVRFCHHWTIAYHAVFVSQQQIQLAGGRLLVSDQHRIGESKDSHN